MVSAINLRESRDFNLFVEFSQLFPGTTPIKLPPFRTINHRIYPKHDPIKGPKWRLYPSKVYIELTKQLNEEEASHWIYHAEPDTSTVVLLVQAK